MNRCPAYRMGEHDFVGMQTDAAVGIGAREAVLEVSLDMHPAGGKLGPDLVVSSGQQVDVIELISLRLPYLPVLQSCKLKIVRTHPAD